MSALTLLSVVGARPQFIKAAVLLRAVARHVDPGRIQHRLIHTGQHYDDAMSGVFFRDLGLPEPDLNLGVGSGTQGCQTGQMLAGVERVLLEVRPDAVVVYGDTNSTLAGALAAVKLNIPVAHVEAGLRSFNRAMPEEVNRVVVDHVSTLLFCPTRASVDNLAREGIVDGVHLVGDVMHESAMYYGERETGHAGVLHRLHLSPGGYALATVHRAENTDAKRRLTGIIHAFECIAESFPVVWPMHPRARIAAAAAGVETGTSRPGRAAAVRYLDPLPYPEMLQLERHAAVILTDSGGVQREACWFGIPCITLRAETEWPETLVGNANYLAGADPVSIVAAFKTARQHDDTRVRPPVEPAADRILDILLSPAARPDARTRW